MQHYNQQLGFAPVIPIIAKAVPAVFSILGGKKKKKAEERMTQYLAAEQQIAAGQAVMATDVMTEADKAFLRKVWPEIHVAADFSHPNWAAHGYPGGPPLTPAAKAAITHVWPQVHVANNFDDVNWQYHAVPIEKVASLLPLPELGYQQPTPTYAPPQTTSVAPPYQTTPYPTVSYPSQSPGTRALAPSQASLIPGVSTETLMIGGVLLAAGLLLFSNRR